MSDTEQRAVNATRGRMVSSQKEDNALKLRTHSGCVCSVSLQLSPNGGPQTEQLSRHQGA